jgi:hypothetical protein
MKADPIAITHRHWRPRYESRPYRPSPGRREAIYGRVQPMTLADRGRRFPSGKVGIAIALLAAAIFALQFVRAASVATSAPHATGTSSASFDAGSAH